MQRRNLTMSHWTEGTQLFKQRRLNETMHAWDAIEMVRLHADRRTLERSQDGIKWDFVEGMPLGDMLDQIQAGWRFREYL